MNDKERIIQLVSHSTGLLPSVVRVCLEAAAPHIAAQASEDAADAFENLPANKGASISSGTWDWFELFPIQHIRDRAEDLRK